MKKFIRTLFLTCIISCTFYCTVFATYNFPANFNFTKAGNMMLRNAKTYLTGDYWISRYKYTGNDTNLQGRNTSNYGWTSPTYTVAFMNDNTHVTCIVLSSTTFHSTCYDVNGTYVSDLSTSGSKKTASFFNHSSPTTVYNSDFTTFLTNTGKDWYYAIMAYNYNDLTLQTYNYQYDWYIYETLDSWFTAIAGNNYDITQNGTQGNASSTGDLPFLSYTLERQTAMAMNGVIPGATTKLNFTWNYVEKEPYSVNPQAYTFDVIAYANFADIQTNLGTTAHAFDKNNLTLNQNNLKFLTKGGQNISLNQFSFLYDDIGKSVYAASNESWLNDSISSASQGYILGIRTCNYQRTQFSYYKLFIVQAGGYVTSTGKVMKNDGTVTDTEADNGNDQMTPTNNGTAGYTGNSNTTAGGDTTGDVYDTEGKLDVSTIISNLKSIVNELGSIPNILAQLMTFIPAWFTSLLLISIGLFVTIGIVKIIVH